MSGKYDQANRGRRMVKLYTRGNKLSSIRRSRKRKGKAEEGGGETTNPRKKKKERREGSIVQMKKQASFCKTPTCASSDVMVIHAAQQKSP